MSPKRKTPKAENIHLPSSSKHHKHEQYMYQNKIFNPFASEKRDIHNLTKQNCCFSAVRRCLDHKGNLFCFWNQVDEDASECGKELGPPAAMSGDKQLLLNSERFGLLEAFQSLLKLLLFNTEEDPDEENQYGIHPREQTVDAYFECNIQCVC